MPYRDLKIFTSDLFIRPSRLTGLIVQDYMQQWKQRHPDWSHFVH